MIVVDTSVFVNFLHKGDDLLTSLIQADQAFVHPMVIGEIGMGSFASADHRAHVINLLSGLPTIAALQPHRFHDFVNKERLFGIGIGFVDAHVLASAATEQGTVWTNDQRLAKAAERMEVLYDGAKR